MKKFKRLILLLFIVLLNSTALQAFELITASEHSLFLGYRSDKPKKVSFRALPNSKESLPYISVLQPLVNKDIMSPTNIKITFKASNNATIDINSLQFLYGWLGFDITKRIKENAEINVSGLSANNVTLPKGEHVITVKISDSMGRTAEKEIEFVIK